MKCPYCGRVVKEIPPHLGKSDKCRIRHADKLKGQLKNILALHKQKVLKLRETE